jgi:hypothetical protein
MDNSKSADLTITVVWIGASLMLAPVVYAKTTFVCMPVSVLNN